MVCCVSFFFFYSPLILSAKQRTKWKCFLLSHCSLPVAVCSFSFSLFCFVYMFAAFSMCIKVKVPTRLPLCILTFPQQYSQFFLFFFCSYSVYVHNCFLWRRRSNYNICGKKRRALKKEEPACPERRLATQCSCSPCLLCFLLHCVLLLLVCFFFLVSAHTLLVCVSSLQVRSLANVLHASVLGWRDLF